VSIAIEELQVRNCNFYQGISTTSGEPQVQLRHMNFTGNSGALLWIQTGTLSDYGSVFATNTGLALGFFGSGTVSSLNYSSFRGNYLTGTLGVLSVEGPEAQVSLHNCEFTGNVAEEASGTLQLLGEADITLHTCHFSRNKALGSLIFVQGSTLLLQNSSISDTLDPLQMEDSTVQVLSTTFSRIFTQLGVFALVRSTLALWNVSLSQVEGSSTYLLFAESSSVALSSVRIHTLTCREEAVKLTDSLFYL